MTEIVAEPHRRLCPRCERPLQEGYWHCRACGHEAMPEAIRQTLEIDAYASSLGISPVGITMYERDVR